MSRYEASQKIVFSPRANTPKANAEPRHTEVLSAQGLKIGYRNKRGELPLAHADLLELHRGEMVCLLGPNGCGKSTLMRSLAGLQPLLKGRVHLSGKALEKYRPKELATQLALVLTEQVPTGNLSVYTLLSLGRYPYLGWLGLLGEQDRAAIGQAINATGITALLERHLQTLSDGQRQKVMIARALVQQTPIIMLDEPTAHLDIPNRVEIMHLLGQMAHAQQKAILLSTHELELALQTADRLWLMMPDGCIAEGAPEDLVLSGAFGRAFQQNGVRFSAETGQFHRPLFQAQTPVALQGEGLYQQWTRRALTRAGFRLESQATICINIDTETHCWKISQGTQQPVVCTSIAALLKELKAWKGSAS